jgi:CubicO group peptidase (beta-lactamase class C family)
VTRPGGLDAFVERVMRQARIPGLSLTLMRGGRTVLSKGYGYRNLKGREPATPRTIYGMASMTKSFTALGIHRLQESRRLQVTDPVVRHLPEFATPEPRWTRRIQIHHFLSNSSGLPPLPSIYYTSARSLARDPPYDPKVARRVGIDPDHRPIDTYEQIMEYLRTTRYRMLGPPGRFFSYSNEAFGLLGAIIERVSGQHFESFVEQEILRPAGMDSTTFDTGVMFRSPEVTTLYSPNWTSRRHQWSASEDWWDDTCLRASGGLRTNIEDLQRYLEIYRTGGLVGRERIVDRTSVEAMMRPHVPISPRLFYGYGLAVQPDFQGTLLVHHSGGLKGVSSKFAVLPRKGLAGAVLANAEGVPSGRALAAGLNQLLGVPMTLDWVHIARHPPFPASLTEYAGWYCSGEGIWVRVRVARSRLRLDFMGIEATEKGVLFSPNGGDDFVRGGRGREEHIRFERNARGRIWAIFLGWRLVRRRSEDQLPKARSGKMEW